MLMPSKEFSLDVPRIIKLLTNNQTYVSGFKNFLRFSPPVGSPWRNSTVDFRRRSCVLSDEKIVLTPGGIGLVLRSTEDLMNMKLASQAM